MTFQPVVPFGGIQGWQFLKSTMPQQKDLHANIGTFQRDVAKFREALPTIGSAEALVSDRSTLKVALGAFGLQDDLDNRYFVRKVMEEGVSDRSSLANRLTDPRYAALAEAFDFSSGAPASLKDPEFADRIVAAYRNRDFEVAVGEVNPDLRLALGLERELGDLASRVSSTNAQWYSVIGSPPLRAVFEGALGLPKSMAAVDVEQQLEFFKQKSQAVFGTDRVGDFLEQDRLKELRQRFLIRSGAENATPTAYSPALSILTTGSASSASAILSTMYV
jgi:hypothetical protein